VHYFTKRRLATIALSAATMLTASSIAFTPAASAHNCPHYTHQHGDIVWYYVDHHTHSAGAPYYGAHHQVYLIGDFIVHDPPSC
jgi:hypothetical protein